MRIGADKSIDRSPLLCVIKKKTTKKSELAIS